MRDDERDDEQVGGEEDQPTREQEQPRAEDQPTKVGEESPARAYEEDDQETRQTERPAWLDEQDDSEGGEERDEDEQPTRVGAAVVNEPAQADEDDEYKWHTGLKRPTGAPDAIEFV